MPRFTIAAGLLWLQAVCLPTASFADEPAHIPVSRWIGELIASDFAQAESAQQQLVELGESVLPELEATTPPEEALAAARLRQTILQIESIAIGKRLAGRRLSLPAGKHTLSEALNQLGAASGFPLLLQPPHSAGERLVEIPTAPPEPFWALLDQICQASGTGWKWGQATGTLEVSSRWFSSAPVIVNGVFRMQAEVFSRGRPFAAPAAEDLVRIQIRLDVEPDVKPFFVRAQTRELTVKTAAGRELAALSPDARRELNSDGQTVAIPYDFYRGEPPDFLKLDLAGEISLVCAAAVTTLQIPLTGDSPTFTAGRTTVLRESVDRRDSEWIVTLQVRFPSDWKWESYQEAQLHREAWLEWPQGLRTASTEREILHSTGSVQSVRFLFPVQDDVAGEPVLSFRVPWLLTTQKIPFEFTDVPVTE